MNQIILLKNEKIIHKIKFSIRVLLIDFLFLIVIMTLASRINRENPGSIFAFILLFIFVPLLIKTVFDFYRIIFHRVFITNLRVIYLKGYLLKRVKIYKIKNIIGVYFRSGFLDFKKNMTSFKVTLDDKQSFILKNVNNGNIIAELLSVHLVKTHQHKNETKN